MKETRERDYREIFRKGRQAAPSRLELEPILGLQKRAVRLGTILISVDNHVISSKPLLSSR